MTLPAVLTIAGSDPSGGAGIQADLKTFTALNCYGASVITTLTAQNTTGVRGVHAPPPEFIKDQLESVLDDIDVLAMKTGMLYDEATIRVVASTLRSHYREKTLRLVCDPVCVSTSGHALLVESALGSLIDEMLPLSTLITPNKSEAELILSHKRKDVKLSGLADIVSASKELLTLGSKAVLLKGGHVLTTMTEVRELLRENPAISVYKYGLLDENMNVLQVGLNEEDRTPQLVVDILQDSSGSRGDTQTSIFIRPRIESTSTHGTGCTLSAAIACGLARGLTIPEAVRDGTIYTYLGILHAFPVGAGHGPLNHTHSLVSRFVPLPCPGDKYPLARALISSAAPTWKENVEQTFLRELGKGLLDKKRFLGFIKQDYHYLTHRLMAARSTSSTITTAAMRSVQGVLQEILTEHKALCNRWGVSERELEDTSESTAATAYGDYTMDVGHQGDTVELNLTLAASLLGYGEVGFWLIEESKRPDSWVVMDEKLNPYVPWIREHSGEVYQKAVGIGLAAIEGVGSMTPITERRFEELIGIWRKCVLLEKRFWDMVIAPS